MLFSELLKKADIVFQGLFDAEAEDIVYDSRKARAGTVFVALRGAKTDGHRFVCSAYAQGCRMFVCEDEQSLPEDAAVVYVRDTSEALAQLSAAFFDFPAKKLKLIGITGTKGKTTTAYIIRHILEKNGRRAGMIGSLGVYYADKYIHTANTTPESYLLHKYFAQMSACGTEYCVMEVSSQAYLCKRVFGITFDIGVFTNLYRGDHIGPGECRDFDHYRECKGNLPACSHLSVINADDEYAPYFLSRAAGQTVTYGMNNPADLTAYAQSLWKEKSSFGISFTVAGEGGRVKVSSRIPGRYSIYNILAAFAVCSRLGLTYEQCAKSVRDCSVKGRFETVDALPWCTCIVDFAHNDVSLRNVLTAVREYEPERLIVLFGSVGGRTELRRGAMGRVAAELADFAVITSDDPDFEDPMKIASDIEKGLGNLPHEVISDRRRAVEWTLRNSRAGDVIVFAGKGHQDYDLVRGKKLPYDERKTIEECAAHLREGAKL